MAMPLEIRFVPRYLEALSLERPATPIQYIHSPILPLATISTFPFHGLDLVSDIQIKSTPRTDLLLAALKNLVGHTMHNIDYRSKRGVSRL